MEHTLPSIDAVVRPWRTAVLVAIAVAAIELLALVVAGIALLGKPLSHHVRQAAESRVLAPLAPAAQATKASKARLSRSQTAVLVLNGNGQSGAAGSEAAHLRSLGYAIGAVGNAQRSDYTTTTVMYRPRFRPEGLRLARDLGVRIVGPLDGLRAGALHGAKVAVIVGR